ncbi:hypothetical protein KC364_g61 [Hortaea werneckii]|nr:hypothetical protein KC364_g61 [Hortaea werneckii]
MPCILPMAVKYRVVPVVAVWFGSGTGAAKEMAGGGRLMPSPERYVQKEVMGRIEDMAGRAAVWQRTTQVVTNFTPAARSATPSPMHGSSHAPPQSHFKLPAPRSPRNHVSTTPTSGNVYFSREKHIIATVTDVILVSLANASIWPALLRVSSQPSFMRIPAANIINPVAPPFPHQSDWPSGELCRLQSGKPSTSFAQNGAISVTVSCQATRFAQEGLIETVTLTSLTSTESTSGRQGLS